MASEIDRWRTRFNDANTRINQLERLNAVLSAEIDLLRPVVDAVIGHKRDLGFKFQVQVEAAVDAYEGTKEQG